MRARKRHSFFLGLNMMFRKRFISIISFLTSISTAFSMIFPNILRRETIHFRNLFQGDQIRMYVLNRLPFIIYPQVISVGGSSTNFYSCIGIVSLLLLCCKFSMKSGESFRALRVTLNKKSWYIDQVSTWTDFWWCWSHL